MKTSHDFENFNNIGSVYSLF